MNILNTLIIRLIRLKIPAWDHSSTRHRVPSILGLTNVCCRSVNDMNVQRMIKIAHDAIFLQD